MKKIRADLIVRRKILHANLADNKGTPISDSSYYTNIIRVFLVLMNRESGSSYKFTCALRKTFENCVR